MEIFIKVSELAVNLKLQQFIQPEDVQTMARSMLLFRDLSDFNTEVSRGRNSRRGDDASTTLYGNMLTHLTEDPHNTSAITLGATDPGIGGLFCPGDIDMNSTQELMTGGGNRDPI